MKLPVRLEPGVKSASRYVVALLFLAASGLGSSSQTPTSVEVPVRVNRAFGLMLVEAKVNGKPAVLILDTGSNRTAINCRLVDVATPSVKDTVSIDKGSGYVGSGVYTKATLAVGHSLWRDHVMIAIDTDAMSKSLGERVDGLLGLDFLGQFELVIVDLKQHKLTLSHSPK
jgi:predicted aspartyl protease